jgi:hypothetical protein
MFFIFYSPRHAGEASLDTGHRIAAISTWQGHSFSRVLDKPDERIGMMTPFDESTDGALVAAFAHENDQAAFEALVVRHSRDAEIRVICVICGHFISRRLRRKRR